VINVIGDIVDSDGPWWDCD